MKQVSRKRTGSKLNIDSIRKALRALYAVLSFREITTNTQLIREIERMESILNRAA